MEEGPTTYSMTRLMQLTPEYLWGPLLRLMYPDLLRFCAVSKDTQKICNTDTFWEFKTRRDFGVGERYPERKNWKEEYKFLFDQASQELVKAATRGDKNKVEGVLALGVDPDFRGKRGNTALFKASLKGHTEVVRELLRQGADPNFQNGWGETALIRTPGSGCTEIVEMLEEAMRTRLR